MKTKSLSTLGMRGLFVTAAAVVAFASVVMLAYADTAPTLTTTAYNQSSVALTSAPIGTNVLVSTVVGTSSATKPTGSLTFNRYAGTSCTGTATVEAGVPLVNGAATSSATAMQAGGLSYMVHYSGDANNVAADSTCKSITATASSVSITGTLSTTTAVLVGSSITEGATLSGATSNAGGSVKYTVYSNNSCTTLWGNAGSKTVTNASVPTSDPFSFGIAGTYYWQAVYSGDANNSAATSSCVALSVIAAPTTPTPPTPGPGSISGIVYKDGNYNDKLDSGETGLANFTVNLYKNAGWWGKKGDNDVFKTTVTNSNGQYSFGSLADGTYSVELIEQKKNGWKQSTSDFRSLTIANGAVLTGIDFGNEAIATSSGKDGKGNNGNHNGWWRGWHWGWWK